MSDLGYPAILAVVGSTQTDESSINQVYIHIYLLFLFDPSKLHRTSLKKLIRELVKGTLKV